MSFADKESRIRALQHAVQSGIAMQINIASGEGALPSECTPKHLRVGVNAAMVDHGALVGLLVEKGVFTLEEYQDARIKMWEREVRSYEISLSERLNTKVSLA